MSDELSVTNSAGLGDGNMPLVPYTPCSDKKLKDFIEKGLVGHYVNRIKKNRELDNFCALGLLLDVVLGEQDKILPNDPEFWDCFVPDLINAYEKNKDWKEVLKLCF